MNQWSAYDRWEARRVRFMDPSTRDLVRAGAIRSANAVLPYVFGALGVPSSVLDVGTGEGHWCEAALALGVGNAHGVDTEQLYPTAGSWQAEENEPLPEFIVRGKPRRWGLGICLEMAEHVTQQAGIHLVMELTRVCDRVLWSAAIPHQGGDGHVNEQWPAWWAGIFAEMDWVLEDRFRAKLWQMSMPSAENIEPWYAQNILLARPAVTRDEAASCIPMPMVHPAFYLSRVAERDAARQGR